MERVDRAPDVRNFVFEQSPREGEYAMNRLPHLQNIGKVPCIHIPWCHEPSQVQKWWQFEGSVVEASIDIVCDTHQEWEVQHSERGHSRQRNCEEPHDVDPGEKADAQQVCEHRRRIEQGHLFETKRANEEDAPPQWSSSDHARKCCNCKAKHDGIVLEVPVVDQYGARLHQDSHQRN